MLGDMKALVRRIAMAVILLAAQAVGPACVAGAPETTNRIYSAIRTETDAVLTIDADGAPLIEARDRTWRVMFIDCASRPCTSLTYYAEMPAGALTLEDTNRLNGT